jgi:hypothetical protein
VGKWMRVEVDQADGCGHGATPGEIRLAGM